MITAIIQARMGSTRLQGKVLMDICGKPMLQHVIERVKQSKKVEQIVVATTHLKEDRAILKLALECDVGVFVGSELNVLTRYREAARCYGANTIVRVTADDPLIDPQLMDRLINLYLQRHPDYMSTVGYPIGLGAEVFSYGCLLKARRNATEIYDKEHVTSYIYSHPELFKLRIIQNDKDESHIRLTVDTLEDLENIRRIYAENRR